MTGVIRIGSVRNMIPRGFQRRPDRMTTGFKVNEVWGKFILTRKSSPTLIIMTDPIKVAERRQTEMIFKRIRRAIITLITHHGSPRPNIRHSAPFIN